MARIFGWDVTVVTPGTAVVNEFTNCRISVAIQTETARATKDSASTTESGWRSPRIKSWRWTIETGAMVNGLPALFEQAVTGLADGATLAVTLTGAGKSFTGNAVIENADFNSPDGPMTQSIRLVGNSPLSVA